MQAGSYYFSGVGAVAIVLVILAYSGTIMYDKPSQKTPILNDQYSLQTVPPRLQELLRLVLFVWGGTRTTVRRLQAMRLQYQAFCSCLGTAHPVWWPRLQKIRWDEGNCHRAKWQDSSPAKVIWRKQWVLCQRGEWRIRTWVQVRWLDSTYFYSFKVQVS